MRQAQPQTASVPGHMTASTVHLERLWTCALQTARGQANPLPMSEPGVPPPPQLQLSVFVPQPRCLKEARAEAGSQLPRWCCFLPSVGSPLEAWPPSSLSPTICQEDPEHSRGPQPLRLPLPPGKGKVSAWPLAPLPPSPQADNTLHQVFCSL